jgi:nucleotide-binding universal stress UspA family protein
MESAMAYKTIIVHLSDPRRSERLLQAAVPLARAMGAHLIGLCVIPPYLIIPAMDGAGVSTTIDAHRTAYRGEVAKLKAAFNQATADLSPPAEWREVDAGYGSVAESIWTSGRASDLVIISQRDSEWSSSSLIEDPERLVMDCGRPVLIVPNTGFASLPPKRVTIAWNGRREAARAIFDALPLLQMASDVNIVWINPEKELPRVGDLPAVEIAAALARHGIKCEATQATAIGADVGAELLRQATVYGSELLVMGCYGHSRLREFVLGGASRHILEQMRLPVLMSH